MDALIHHLENREDLEPREITVAAEFLLDEGVGLPKKKRLLKALATKGETAAEIAEFVAVFLEKAVKPDFLGQTFEGPTIDVCGTGGDKLDLFNISTTSMFIVAAAGATVIKHGNRGVTSKSGSSDVLSELGIPLDLSSEKVGECLGKAGVGFLFAPLYHPAFKAVAPVRAELAKEGVRTIFNLIGPLLNPAQPECQLVGVMDEALCPVFADILQRMGRDSAWSSTVLPQMDVLSMKSVSWGLQGSINLEASRGSLMRKFTHRILIWRLLTSKISREETPLRMR